MTNNPAKCSSTIEKLNAPSRLGIGERQCCTLHTPPSTSSKLQNSSLITKQSLVSSLFGLLSRRKGLDVLWSSAQYDVDVESMQISHICTQIQWFRCQRQYRFQWQSCWFHWWQLLNAEPLSRYRSMTYFIEQTKVKDHSHVHHITSPHVSYIVT